MKKDWTETMRDKLSESAVTPPDDMWAGISSRLAAPVPSPRKSPLIWRWVAVAACLGALVVCGVWLFDTQGTKYKVQSTKYIAQAEGVDQGGEAAHQGEETASSQGRGAASSQTFDQSSESEVASVINTDVVSGAGSSPSLNAQSLDSPSLESVTSLEGSDTTVVDVIDYERLLLTQAQEGLPAQTVVMNHKKLSLSLYACNTNMTGLGKDDIKDDWNCNFGTSCTIPNGDEDQKTSRSASDSYTVADVRHKQPIRFGLSARIPVSGSLSIGAGVTYSRLSSSITLTDSNNYYFEKDQTLHYIGVPVSVDYNLPSYRSLDFYLTAGAMAEKCVYGQSRVPNSPVSERVTEKGLQLSMYAGAGMQLNLNTHLAVYAEPLATYCFDNHSGVTNIYKDRPLNIDLRVGLRYTFR